MNRTKPGALSRHSRGGAHSRGGGALSRKYGNQKLILHPQDELHVLRKNSFCLFSVETKHVGQFLMEKK